MAYIETRTVGNVTYDIHDAKLRDDIASTEETSTATATHIEGSYFIYNDILYRATANIAIGDTITSGTNCTAVTVGGELIGKLNSSNVYNGLDKSVPGFALDARQGKALNDQINSASTYGELGPVAIASIQDASPLDAESLVVDIEPVQDLHGYDNPWPAGGGKNMVPLTVENVKRINTTGTWNGNIYTIGNTTFSLFADESGAIIKIEATSNDAGFRRFFLGEVSVVANQSYTISGFVIGGSYDFGNLNPKFDGTGDLNITSPVNMTADSDKTSILSYYIKALSDGPNTKTIYPMVCLSSATNPTTFSPYSNICPITGRTGANVVVSPTTDAQDGTTYPISWQSEAGTVYGGTLDVTTGLLTVDRAEVDLGTLTWSYYADYASFVAIVSDKKRYESGMPYNRGILTSIYPAVDYWWDNPRKPDKSISCGAAYNIVIKDSSYTDAAAFKAAMSGVQLVYELATPQTYQLTPQQQVELLQGENNVWADCGNTTVGFWRDDSLSINKAITERSYDRKQGEALADKLDATQSDIAIIINGNQTTHTGGVAVGEYVIVRSSTISGITDGMYKAVQAISANTAITSAYLAAVSGGGLNDSIAKQSANIGIVETGTTCTHTGGIAAGQYVIWQGALYTADAAISVGETLASSGGNKNLTVCPNGGLNALINNTVINITGDFPATLIKTGNVVNCCFSVKLLSNYNAGASLFQLPSGYRPIAQTPLVGTKVSGSSVSIARYWRGDNSNYLVTGQAAQINDFLQFYGTWIANS